MTKEQDEVLAANQRFYDAFEASSMDLLEAAWERSDRVVCTHPGWVTLRGWEPVMDSWRRILEGPRRLQFILTNAHVEVDGGLAWVTVDENLVDQAMTGGTMAALNLFARSAEGEWKVVAHHGSPVAH